ncbi:hypothetical protein N5J77_22740 [Sphingobium yanoikuyae]|nr:hypothetical protein [Sphingobium yanoikuyae]MDH2133954.1 hypothetical protein [Sphingobium yanoikuyae]MDH2169344.1 hypothetical protein [Sphingobium yanoikuyae]
MSILIVSVPGDAHAIYVELGLKALNQPMNKIFLTEIPQRASISHDSNCGRNSIIYESSAGSLNLTEFDTIWLRRMGRPVLGDAVHEDDRRYAELSWKSLVESIWLQTELSGGFHINDPRSALEHSAKPLHLDIATASGLKIPPTLISNSRDKIIDFINLNTDNDRQTIVKGFFIPVWYCQSSGSGLTTGTEIVTIRDVEASEIEACPAIYQARIPKSYEVRLTKMGGYSLAGRFVHRPGDDTEVDFRRTPDWTDLGMERCDIPDAINIAVSIMFKKLNLVFGSIDFIVDDQGQWWFVDLNPMGNFFWVEAYCPEIPLLDTFCHFLMSRDPKFQLPRNHRPKLRLQDVAPNELLRSFIDTELTNSIKYVGERPVIELGAV